MKPGNVFTEFHIGERTNIAVFKYRRIVESYKNADNAEDFHIEVGDIIGGEIEEEET